MSVKYIRFSVAVHGVEIKNKVVVDAVMKRIKTEVGGILLAETRIKFRDEFDTDIEVDVDEFAGEFED